LEGLRPSEKVLKSEVQDLTILISYPENKYPKELV